MYLPYQASHKAVCDTCLSSHVLSARVPQRSWLRLLPLPVRLCYPKLPVCRRIGRRIAGASALAYLLKALTLYCIREYQKLAQDVRSDMTTVDLLKHIVYGIKAEIVINRFGCGLIFIFGVQCTVIYFVIQRLFLFCFYRQLAPSAFFKYGITGAFGHSKAYVIFGNKARSAFFYKTFCPSGPGRLIFIAEFIRDIYVFFYGCRPLCVFMNFRMPFFSIGAVPDPDIIIS